MSSFEKYETLEYLQTTHGKKPNKSTRFPPAKPGNQQHNRSAT
jgi:hypothetical protein